MKNHGFLTQKSIVSGTSGGSLGALVACLDVDPKDAVNILVEMSKQPNLYSNIDKELKSTLNPLLPSDILERCNGRLHVVVVKVWQPMTEPVIISQFESKEKIIEAIAASCFIPIYSARRLSTKITGETGLFADGMFTL